MYIYISIYLFIHLYKYNIYQVVPSISIPSISFRLSTWLFRRVALRGAQVNKASSPKYSPAKVAGGGSSYLDVPLEPRLGELSEFVGRSERAKNKVLNELPLIQARPKGLHAEYRRILRVRDGIETLNPILGLDSSHRFFAKSVSESFCLYSLGTLW